GFAPSGHPLSLLRASLPAGVVQSDALPKLEHGVRVEVAGLVVARQRPETAKGFVFVLLDDVAGMVNVIVRPDVYDRYRATIRGEPLLWIAGKLAKDDGTVNVIAEEAQGLKVGTRNEQRVGQFRVPTSAFRVRLSQVHAPRRARFQGLGLVFSNGTTRNRDPRRWLLLVSRGS